MYVPLRLCNPRGTIFQPIPVSRETEVEAVGGESQVAGEIEEAHAEDEDDMHFEDAPADTGGEDDGNDDGNDGDDGHQ